MARCWGQITAQVRDRLITSATTQVQRSDYGDAPIGREFAETAPSVYAELSDKVAELSRARVGKPGKKSYDLMVAGYFRDMFQVLKRCRDCLKGGGHMVLVLGDSAPYGVHVPTDDYLGRVAVSLGFREYQTYKLRDRGGKWAGNTRRHDVPLREGLLVLKK